jgi:hypothetical protein
MTDQVEAVKPGDRVRVVLEGVVTEVDNRTFTVGDRGSNYIWPEAEHVVSVEVLRPPVKVNDLIDSVEGLSELPLDSVVIPVREYAVLQKRYRGEWFIAGSSKPLRADLINLPVKVLSLPEDESEKGQEHD